MAVARTERHHLVAPECAWCRCFPCVCLRERPCSCGGRIVVMAGIAEAVAGHQRTPRHAAWREAMGL